ncbi:polyphenol oxidase family protein [Arthrobacter sp. LAPM80]|uniref:polyphenol oxidase family protein n=1 Tax=Arthrobacter sp. LAPM80 TaxID=3141788 RepID=UPI00398B9535
MWLSEQVRPGIWVGFTDADAGNLAFHVGDDPTVVANHRKSVETLLAGAAGVRAVKLAYMNQVHGAEVASISAGISDAGTSDAGTSDTGTSGGGAPTADAMVTTAQRLIDDGPVTGLAVMVADCVPVVLVGQTRAGEAVLAVAHAGRPGVQKNVIAAVMAQMRLAGAESIEAWLGPSVCGKCYEVPQDLRAAVAGVAPQAHATTSWGTPSLDLPAAVLAQLAGAGATAHPSGICTLEDPRYFSHRRAQRDGGAEGRFIGFVAAVPIAPDDESTPAP